MLSLDCHQTNNPKGVLALLILEPLLGVPRCFGGFVAAIGTSGNSKGYLGGNCEDVQATMYVAIHKMVCWMPRVIPSNV